MYENIFSEVKTIINKKVKLIEHKFDWRSWIIYA